MKKRELVLVCADDWEALYINGKCVHQDHSIDLATGLALLNINIEEKWADNHPDLDISGRFPDELEEVVFDEK